MWIMIFYKFYYATGHIEGYCACEVNSFTVTEIQRAFEDRELVVKKEALEKGNIITNGILTGVVKLDDDEKTNEKEPTK